MQGWREDSALRALPSPPPPQPPIPHPALVHSLRPSQQRLPPHPSLQQDCLYQSDPKSLRWQFYPEFPWQVTISLTLSSAFCSNTVHFRPQPFVPPHTLTLHNQFSERCYVNCFPNTKTPSSSATTVFKPRSVQSPPETSNYALTSSTLSVPRVTLLSVPLFKSSVSHLVSHKSLLSVFSLYCPRDR